jgi:membrane associated rhomboid family serine protease
VDYVRSVSQQPHGQQPRPARRTPKFTAFLLTGALAGLLIGFFLSVIGPVDAGYDSAVVLGFLGLIFAGLGALVGAIIAVLLEKRP